MDTKSILNAGPSSHSLLFSEGISELGCWRWKIIKYRISNTDRHSLRHFVFLDLYNGRNYFSPKTIFIFSLTDDSSISRQRWCDWECLSIGDLGSLTYFIRVLSIIIFPDPLTWLETRVAEHLRLSSSDVTVTSDSWKSLTSFPFFVLTDSSSFYKVYPSLPVRKFTTNSQFIVLVYPYQ